MEITAEIVAITDLRVLWAARVIFSKNLRHPETIGNILIIFYDFSEFMEIFLRFLGEEIKIISLASAT